MSCESVSRPRRVRLRGGCPTPLRNWWHRVGPLCRRAVAILLVAAVGADQAALAEASREAGFSSSAPADSLRDDRGTPIEARSVERVAAISTFAADTLVALGVSPVGASSFGNEPLPSYLDNPLPSYLDNPLAGYPDNPLAGYPEDPLAGTRSLGQRASTNLELLAELSPELIIGIHRYTESYARQLKAIAPFYAFDVVSLADSRRAVTGIAAALGKRPQGERLNQAFDERLVELGEQAPGGINAVLLAGAGEAPFAYYDHFLTASLLERLNATNAAGPSPTPNQTIPFGYSISLERLLALDPDVIFLFSTGSERTFANNPIWPYLKAVKSGRVYEVGPHWKEGGGPIARRLILDEMAWRLYPETFDRPDLPDAIASHP